jgi:hypothetical protein
MPVYLDIYIPVTTIFFLCQAFTYNGTVIKESLTSLIDTYKCGNTVNEMVNGFLPKMGLLFFYQTCFIQQLKHSIQTKKTLHERKVQRWRHIQKITFLVAHYGRRMLVY